MGVLLLLILNIKEIKMKKCIIIAFVLIFNFVTAQEKPINEDLKKEYDLMLVSDSYKDFEKAAENYVNKIYFLKTFNEICYESLFLKVLKEEIKLTSFKDYEEAEKEYFILKEKYSVMKELNSGFYLALKDSNLSDLANIIAPFSMPETDSCHCEITYNKSLRMLAFQYENVLKNKEKSVLSTWIAYSKEKLINKKAYEMCKHGCELR